MTNGDIFMDHVISQYQPVTNGNTFIDHGLCQKSQPILIFLEPSHRDDTNKQTTLPPYQPVTNGNTFMDYVRSHKLTVLIAIIILIALIWWFCMRKSVTTSNQW